MTGRQLEELLDQTVEILHINQEVCTPDLLERMNRILDSLMDPPDILLVLLGMEKKDFSHLVQQGKRLLAIEHDLTTTDKTRELIRVLTTLRNRPLVLKLLANFI